METMKPKSKLRAATTAMNPIHQVGSAARAGLRPASEGWQLLTGMLGRLARHPAKPMPDGFDARQHFTEKCQRHGLDKRKLAEIELALLRTKRAMLFFFFLTFALTLGQLANADRLFDIIVAAATVGFTAYAGAKALQLSIQLRQVRDRSLYTFRQFLGLFPTKTDLVAFLLDPEL